MCDGLRGVGLGQEVDEAIAEGFASLVRRDLARLGVPNEAERGLQGIAVDASVRVRDTEAARISR